MKQSRLQIAKSDILRYFDSIPERTLRPADMERILAEQRFGWRLAQRTRASHFIRFLADAGKLTEIVFPFPKPYKREIRYTWGQPSLYQVIQTLKPRCYFSHYTAVKLHGLTEQLPKTFYLNVEQKNASISSGGLTQKSIDNAFRNNPRVSGNAADTKDFRVVIIGGKNTGNLGVIAEKVIPDAGTLRFTNLERTLIDIAVRPIYAGGVFEVGKAYELAKERVSVNRLAAMLQKLAFTYPYHQAIGFYLERAGCKPEALALLRQLPMEFDFYLTHKMGETDYVKEWRLHVPKGF
jgi:hypothetical protein